MNCTLCPRRCQAWRDAETAAGTCHMPTQPIVARAALHFGEEPPLSGCRGAGAVFFSGCSLRCVFCQNSAISQDGFGRAVTVERLAEIFFELAEQGAHNLNLVTPTQFTPAILTALDLWRKRGQDAIPVVWNSSAYELPETLRACQGRVEIFLPDLKYMDSERAARYSSAPDYPQTACAAIREMFAQTGPCLFDENGLLKRGVLIRHLLLPGGLKEAKAVMDWVGDTFPRGSVYFSLMSQYVPLGQASVFPELRRRLRKSEIRAAQEYMAALGLPGFVQDADAASGEYVPAFDLTGV